MFLSNTSSNHNHKIFVIFVVKFRNLDNFYHREHFISLLTNYLIKNLKIKKHITISSVINYTFIVYY